MSAGGMLINEVVGVSAANAAGWKATSEPYMGLDDTLRVMVIKFREGVVDPRIAGEVGKVLIAAGRPKKTRDQVQALLDDFRSRTVYGPDPSMAERVAGAAITLCIDPTKCVPLSDCDDRLTAMATELGVINIPVEFVLQETGAQPHVLARFLDPDANNGRGEWTYLDPGGSLEASDPAGGIPIGKAPFAIREEYVNPFAAIPKLGIAAATPKLVTFGKGRSWVPPEGMLATYAASPASLLVGAGASVIAVPATGYVIPSSFADGKRRFDITLGVGDTLQIIAPPVPVDAASSDTWQLTLPDGATVVSASTVAPPVFFFTAASSGGPVRIRGALVKADGSEDQSTQTFEYHVTVVPAAAAPGDVSGADPTQTPQPPPPGDEGVGIGEVLLYATGAAVVGGLGVAVARRLLRGRRR